MPGGDKPMAPEARRRLITIAIVAFVLGLLIIPSLFSNKTVKTISYSALIHDARHSGVISASINTSSGVVTGQLSNGTNYTANGPAPALTDEVTTFQTNNVVVTFANPSSFLSTFLPYLIWILIFVGFFVFANRQAKGQMNGMMSVGRSKAKQFNQDRPTTTFADVAGYFGVKQEISEVVEFLKTPARYKEIGAMIPKGILLVGPPGTGKTMLARAVAGEAGVPFFSVSGSDFMEMFVGVGASRVRDLFATARKQSPAIVFIDEIDSIGRKRGAGVGGGHDEREQTLNQMLNEMDGFDPTEGVVVIAATNRDLAAEVKAGRFREDLFYRLNVIAVTLPGLRDRPADLRRLADSVRRYFGSRAGKGDIKFSQAVSDALGTYPWPGNLRELRNVIERAVILAPGDTIELADLPEEFSAARSQASAVGARVTLDELEAEHIRRILASSRNLDEAARILGIDPATLYRKRSKLGLL